MSEDISIAGLNKGAVFAALYNRAKVQGLGALHATPENMTAEEGTAALEDSPRLYFDYHKGRVMKVDLSTDLVNPALYDRDNGAGAFDGVIQTLR